MFLKKFKSICVYSIDDRVLSGIKKLNPVLPSIEEHS